MKKFTLFVALCLSLGLAVPAFAAGSVATQAAHGVAIPSLKEATPLSTPAPLQPITQLGQTLQTLVGTSATQAAPAAAEPAPATLQIEDSLGQITDTFATGILETVAKTVESLKAHSTVLDNAKAAPPDFTDWYTKQSADPRRVALWAAIGTDLPIVIGTPLLVAAGMILLLLPLRNKMKRSQPRDWTERSALVTGLLLMRALPAVLFLGASLLLLDQNELHKLPRFVLLNIIYAVTMCFIVQQTLRGFFSPAAPYLRLFEISQPQASGGYRWFTAYGLILVFSYFFIDVANALRVPSSVIASMQNLFALVLIGMTLAVTARTRFSVAAILRGPAEEPETPPSFTRALRSWLAWHWHTLASAYLLIILGIVLLGIENGFALMLRGTIFSIVILAAARFAFIAIEKWKTPENHGPALTHRTALALLMRPVVWGVAAVGIAATWGVRVDPFLSSPTGQHTVTAVLSLAITLTILTVLYEVIHSAIERHLNRHDKETKQLVATARARTLLPMVRNSIFMLFCAIAALTFLSAVGINIAPLLAGAGVLGVAIGFGSQTLVKDFLTGLFIVLENTVAVGDVVTIGAQSGVVEALSIRALRLRDVDGSLHIIPFSEVTRITNKTKGFAYALVDIEVAYESDLERVMAVLGEVGATLQEDPVFKRVVLEPIEIMGVENLGAYSITIRSRVRTRPGKQWDVRRYLLLRIKQRFDKEGIIIPFPIVTNMTKVIP